MSPRWRKEVPAEVADLARLHGKALAWGRTGSGAVVLATKAALVIDGIAVLPWERIDRANWDTPKLRIEYRDQGGAPARLDATFAEEGGLPPVIHHRVTRSVVTSRRVELPGGVGAVLAARRSIDGAVTWTVVFDAGADPSDPALQDAARTALRQYRESLGV